MATTSSPARRTASAPGLPPNELWLYHRLGGSGVKLTVAATSTRRPARSSRATGGSSTTPRAGRGSPYEPNLRRGLWSIVRYDRIDRRADDADQRHRRRGAAGDLARWQDAGLHQPARRRHRAGGAHARDRRRARAGARTDARRPGRLCGHGRVAQLRLHAGRPVAGLQQQGRSASARAGPGLDAAGDSVHRPGVDRAGADRHQTGPPAARARSRRRSCAARSSRPMDARSSSRHSAACGSRRSRAAAPPELRAG